MGDCLPESEEALLILPVLLYVRRFLQSDRLLQSYGKGSRTPWDWGILCLRRGACMLFKGLQELLSLLPYAAALFVIYLRQPSALLSFSD